MVDLAGVEPASVTSLDNASFTSLVDVHWSSTT